MSPAATRYFWTAAGENEEMIMKTNTESQPKISNPSQNAEMMPVRLTLGNCTIAASTSRLPIGRTPTASVANGSQILPFIFNAPTPS